MRMLIVSAALLGFVADPSLAADKIDVQEPVNTVVADWSGWYAGVHAGYGFTRFGGVHDDVRDLARNLQDPLVDGFLAGGQLGYNWQTGALVYGIEADGTWSNQDFSFRDEIGTIQQGEIEALYSLRAIMGATSDRTLVYLTGGLAYGEARFEVDRGGGNSGSATIGAWGGVIGGGIEYAVTDNIALRAEALHYMFYDRKDIPNLINFSYSTDRFEFKDNTVFRLGLNFRPGAGMNAAGDASAAVHDWSGWHVGAHAGYGLTKFGGVYDEAGDLAKTLQDPFVNGFLGGGQIGYNWQSGAWVYGIEGDATASKQGFDFRDSEGSLEQGDIKSLYSLRGVLGIAADQTLAYLTGGLAYGKAEFSADEGTDSGTFKIASKGAVIGGGVEYAMTDHVSVRGEALHYMFYDQTPMPDLTFDSDSEDRFEFRNNTVFRVGVNYRF